MSTRHIYNSLDLNFLFYLTRQQLCNQIFYRKNTETDETVLVYFTNVLDNRLMCVDGKTYKADGRCINDEKYQIVMLNTKFSIKE